MHAEKIFKLFFTLLWDKLVIPLLLLLLSSEMKTSTRTVFTLCILVTFPVIPIVVQGSEVNSNLTKSSERLQLTKKKHEHTLDKWKRAKHPRRPSRPASTMEDEEEAAGVQHKQRAKLRKGQKPNIIFILADDLGKCLCIFGKRGPNDPRHGIKRYSSTVKKQA